MYFFTFIETFMQHITLKVGLLELKFAKKAFLIFSVRVYDK